MKKRSDYSEDWGLFLTGQDYNNKLSPPYYKTIDTNIDMYIGDQWKGVISNGLPTPVFNIFKRVINHLISSITSQDITMQLVSGEEDDNVVIGDVTIAELTELVSAYFKTIKDNTKMSSKMTDLLLDGALTGDYCIYSKWDDEYNTKSKMGIDPLTNEPAYVMGDIDNEIIDSVNVFLGNPNSPIINENGKPKQPYIIVSFRRMTSEVKKIAKSNGVSQRDIDLITSDTDSEYQAGARGKQELEGEAESGKTTCVMKFYPKNGTIYARQSTKFCVIQPDKDTKLRIYPIAWGNWENIKNSYHGQAIGTGLVPNQLFVNKLFAMAMVSQMNVAFPRMIYDSTRISKPSNAVGASYGIEGDISNAMQIVQGANMSPQVMQLIDMTINYTKEMLGASDAALGNVKPDNTSAIIAVQQAAAVPLEIIKRKLHQFYEDLGNIWLETMINYYGERPISATINGEKVTKTIDFSLLKDLKLSLKVEAGASSHTSQLTTLQTLDNFLASDRITFLQYLKGLPTGIINNRNELIAEEEERMNQAQQNNPTQQNDVQAVAQFAATLPQEVQAQLKQLPPEQAYTQAKSLMEGR